MDVLIGLVHVQIILHNNNVILDYKMVLIVNGLELYVNLNQIIMYVLVLLITIYMIYMKNVIHGMRNVQLFLK